MGPADLAQVLQPLKTLWHAQQHPNLLVGLDIADDAAVYRLNDEQAVIATTDFFPPVVDDAYQFGAIAAANAMSDVYAMGGEVLFAINLAAFPDDLDRSILTEILRGGAEKVAEAGGVVVGGHTVSDHEPKYGLAVTGLVHPQRILTKGAARPGDVLIVTKPLGTGVVTTALKREQAEAADVEAAIASMMRLNRVAAQVAQQIGVHAATDITGFGLLGHAYECANQGGVAFRFHTTAIPWLPGARRYAAERMFAGGLGRNRDYFGQWVTFAPEVTPDERALLFDPQTSGGLLLAVPPDRVEPLRAACRERGQATWAIGQVLAGTGIEVVAA
jgi:selenide,water dikinase